VILYLPEYSELPILKNTLIRLRGEFTEIYTDGSKSDQGTDMVFFLIHPTLHTKPGRLYIYNNKKEPQ